MVFIICVGAFNELLANKAALGLLDFYGQTISIMKLDIDMRNDLQCHM